jgi:hypothetical protein
MDGCQAKVKADAEELQRRGRHNDVAAAVDASSEAKACTWIKGRCVCVSV